MAKSGDVKAELKEKIANGEVILLVGSAVSREATEKTEVASWDGLVASGADWLDSRDHGSAGLVRRDLPAAADKDQRIEITNRIQQGSLKATKRGIHWGVASEELPLTGTQRRPCRPDSPREKWLRRASPRI